ncbi:hypothetical protein ACOMHN_029621 [Nucella lapillus]
MLKTVSDGTGSVWLSSSASYDRERGANASATEILQVDNSTATDPDIIVSDEEFKIASRLIFCGFVPALSLLGLPANILNMVVFYHQGLRDKMNLCLFALAFVDFVYVFSMLLKTSFYAASFLPEDLWVQILKWTILKFTINFQYAFMYSSGVLTAIIATERCICVVWPLKSATIFKTKTMAWMIFGTVVILNLLCLLYALKHVVRLKTDEAGKAAAILDDTDLYVNNKLAFQIVRDGILPSISFITFFVVSFVTVVNVRKLKTAMDWRQKTSSHVIDKRQMTLVKMLVSVSCVYIACNAPYLSLAIARFLVEGFSTIGKQSNLFYVIHRSTNTLLMVNSSVNIFIYYKQS